MFNKPWLKAGLVGTGAMVILRVLRMIPCINCLICPITFFAWLVVPMGTGYYATHLAEIKNNLEKAAKEGALSGMVVGVIGGGISYILTLIFSILGFSINMNLTGFQNADNRFNNIFTVQRTFLMSIIWGVGVWISSIILYMVFSVLGAIIKSSLKK